MRKMIVGRSVGKYSTRIQEDGTELRSSVCTVEFNVWERCCDLWAKEEMYTDGYTKKSKYPNKYDSSYKRKAHFMGELKFAHAKAETKAHEKTIRELAGLQTGYKKEELSKGELIFSKVRRSRIILQSETAAKLAALSQGKQIESKVELFGEDHSSEMNISLHEDEHKEPDPPKKSKQDELIEVLDYYVNESLIIKELDSSVANLLNWLKSTKEAEKNVQYWTKAMTVLKAVEEKIPNEGKKDHNIV
jgi:hypothetical protein